MIISKRKVLVVIADGYEDIEVIAPVDILNRAGAEVVLASLKGGAVKGAWGSCLSSDLALADIKTDFDAIVIPGGLENAKALAASQLVVDRVKKMAADGKLVAAICASPACVLAEAASLLRGRRACGYVGFNQRLVACGAQVVDQQVVVDQNIITAVGPGAAILFGLQIVKHLLGINAAEEIAQQWQIECW